MRVGYRKQGIKFCWSGLNNLAIAYSLFSYYLVHGIGFNCEDQYRRHTLFKGYSLIPKGILANPVANNGMNSLEKGRVYVDVGLRISTHLKTGLCKGGEECSKFDILL